ncbi:mitochondrial inner membrane protease subunit 1 isoform X2 [Amborella trichopoda]|uniref:mitochondrial inner membrane protease subunit 1 isoform X2 n=1 Tax=Amborella trichopoda TaxID=13333 RepID=UPI0009BF8D9C|nr:mitochondrial inner membrane protease subunit 1 isoform X2 [Amborella trichopoda]XP_020522377.1 mitochondrial inner membrane protease subunit 1 isoform X2 [Amborella trichopoda]|eukprot:XP_020522376.1 mitochondrial inner membrane protease subunit 1 isoform X2 [Amborella trichopoda]
MEIHGWFSYFFQATCKGCMALYCRCSYIYLPHACHRNLCLFNRTGPSMAPTLNNDGDVLIVERLSSRHGRIYPGDIVIACSPQNPNIKICKRVIGLEGDHISFHPNVGSRKVITVTVPKGHVWLQGDNIMHSQDSRHYGPVPFALLKGKVWMRAALLEWPFLMEEIQKIVADLGHDKAPGSDSLSVSLFHQFWDTHAPFTLAFFSKFHRWRVIHKGMNSTFIALVLKIEGAAELKDFRPISLLTKKFC